jgi:citrate lyase beta subunit
MSARRIPAADAARAAAEQRAVTDEVLGRLEEAATEADRDRALALVEGLLTERDLRLGWAV